MRSLFNIVPLHSEKSRKIFEINRQPIFGHKYKAGFFILKVLTQHPLHVNSDKDHFFHQIKSLQVNT